MSLSSIKKPVLLFGLLLFLHGCGYSNPYIKPSTGDEVERKLHITMWENYSGELGFQADIHQRLIYWLNKFPNWRIVQNPAQADYLISGVIDSADFPGLSYDLLENVKELRAEIRFGYEVKSKTGKTILKKVNSIKRETFSVSSIATSTEGAKREALKTIADDIADEIYIRLFHAISRWEEQQK